MAARRASRLPGIAVAGHVNVDHLFEVPFLPLTDRTTPVRSHRIVLGGPAANVARAASREGLRVRLLSRIGADFPRELLAQLRSDRVPVGGLERVPGEPSSAAYIFEDQRGGQTTAFQPGPIDRGGAVKPSDLGDARWLHLTTGSPEYLSSVKEAGLRRGMHVAADPAQEIRYRWDGPGLRRLLDRTEILFGNAAEIRHAATLLGVATVRQVTERVPLVVATQGARGAVAYTRTGHVEVRAPRHRGAVHVTGAGDAFRGGFWRGWLAGEPLRDCLLRGTGSAARWMVREGRGDPPQGAA